MKIYDFVFDIAKYGLMAYIGYTGIIYSITYYDWIDAYRNIKFGLFLYIIPLVVTIYIVSAFLLNINYAVFGFSWLSLIGNFFGKSVEGTNLSTIGLTLPFIGIVLCLSLLVRLPSWAANEEKIFRKGTKDWFDGSIRSFIFGLIHMIMGVPFGVALALSIGGFFFTYLYFKGGIKLSSLGHFQYNLILILFAFVYAITATIRTI